MTLRWRVLILTFEGQNDLGQTRTEVNTRGTKGIPYILCYSISEFKERYSVLLYSQPFSSQRPLWRGCTKWPQMTPWTLHRLRHTRCGTSVSKCEIPVSIYSIKQCCYWQKVKHGLKPTSDILDCQFSNYNGLLWSLYCKLTRTNGEVLWLLRKLS